MLTTTEQIIKDLTKQLNDSTLEPSLMPGIKFLIEKYTHKEVSKPKKPTKFNMYKSRLGTAVAIDSTSYYHNEIIDIGASVYVDCTTASYSFSSSSGHMNLGCIPDRRRERVLFDLKDVKPFINSKLETWLKKEENANLKLSTSIKDAVNKVVLMVRINGYNIKIYPYRLVKNTLLKPYRLVPVSRHSGGRCDTELQAELCKDLSKLCYKCGGENRGLYTFSQKDINRLIKDIEKVYSELYKA